MNRAGMLLLDIFFPNRCDCCGERIPFDLLICEDCIAALSAQRVQYREWAAGQTDLPWENGAVLFRYDGIARTGVLGMKDGRRGFSAFAAKLLAEELADLLPDKGSTVVTWVPIARSRRRIQGYAHAEMLARSAAKEMRLPVRDGLILEQSSVTRQHDLPAAERAKYAERFSAGKKRLSGETVLLFDDILTTGATLRRCAKLLRSSGAGSVIIAAVCCSMHSVQSDP